MIRIIETLKIVIVNCLLFCIHIDRNEFTKFFFELFVHLLGPSDFIQLIDVRFDVISGGRQRSARSNE